MRKDLMHTLSYLVACWCVSMPHGAACGQMQQAACRHGKGLIEISQSQSCCLAEPARPQQVPLATYLNALCLAGTEKSWVTLDKKPTSAPLPL